MALLLLLLAAAALADQQIEQTSPNMQNLAGQCIKFKPQKAATYSFSLTSSDGCSSYHDTVDVNVLCPTDDTENIITKRGVMVKSCTGDNVATVASDKESKEYTWDLEVVPENSQVTIGEHEARKKSVSFTPDVIGNYEIVVHLSPDDCCGYCHERFIIEYACPDVPVADAGDDVSRTGAGYVQLDRSKLYADRDDLSFSWKVINAPTLSHYAMYQEVGAGTLLKFEVDTVGEFDLEFSVSDCCSTTKDIVKITAACPSEFTAYAGDDQHFTSCAPFKPVTIEGSYHGETYGAEPVYLWSIKAKPKGSTLTDKDVRGFDNSKAIFVPDTTGVYDIQMNVTDCCGQATDEMRVVISPPDMESVTVDAVTHKYVCQYNPATCLQHIGHAATKRASNNHAKIVAHAPKGSKVTWKLVDKPPSSKIDNHAFADPHAAETGFSVDVAGKYLVSVTAKGDCTTTSSVTTPIDFVCSDLDYQPDAGLDRHVDKECGKDKCIILSMGGGNVPRIPDGVDERWEFVSKPKNSQLTDDDIRYECNPDCYDCPPKVWFCPDVAGSYQIKVTAQDCCAKHEDMVTIDYTCSEKLIAEAGDDATLTVQDHWPNIILDGSGSECPNGLCHYTWTLVDKPEGSKDTSDSIYANTAIDYGATFRPDSPGTYKFMINVSDCCTWITDTKVVNIECDQRPQITSGDVGVVYNFCSEETQIVALGCGFGNMSATFNWKITEAPAGITASEVILQQYDQCETSIAFSREMPPGEYDVQLKSDGLCGTYTDVLRLQYRCRSVLVPNAGDDTQIYRRTEADEPFEPIKLDCSASKAVPCHCKDAKDHTTHFFLNYEWSIVSKPKDSKIENHDIENSVTAIFTPDVAGDYILNCTIADCCHAASDTVMVTAQEVCSESLAQTLVDAGADQQITGGCCNDVRQVELAGAVHPVESDMTFKWEMVSKPPNSHFTSNQLSNSDKLNATATLDVNGEFIFKLTVADSCTSTSDYVTIVRLCGRSPVPVADPPQDIMNTKRAFVYAKKSYDPDTQKVDLTYAWRFTKTPPGSNLTDAGITKIHHSDFGAFFYPDAPGCYDMQIEMSDCCSNGTSTTRVCASCNTPPTVIVSVGRSGALVTPSNECGAPPIDLDCSESFDTDKDHLAFAWSFVDQPYGSNLTAGDIHGQYNPLASFTPDMKGRYEVQCLVSDGCNGASKTAVVWFRCSDFAPPILAGGKDLTLHRQCGKTPSLTITNDNALASVHYSWSFISAPKDSKNHKLTDRAATSAVFTPDDMGTYAIKVTGHDCCHTHDATVKVAYGCFALPTANAGTDQYLRTKISKDLRVQVDAASSSDSSGHVGSHSSLTYSWSFLYKPKGSSATIEDEHAKIVSFHPDMFGSYTLQLQAADCCGVDNDTVTIEVVSPECEIRPEVAITTDAPVVVVDCQATQAPWFELTASEEAAVDSSYRWHFVSTGSNSLLYDGDIMGRETDTARFQPDAVTSYTLEVVASSGDQVCEAGAQATVEYKCNNPPEVFAGDDYATDDRHSKILLEGEAQDPEGDPLNATWSFVNVPSGSCREDRDIFNQGGLVPFFYPDVVGCYDLEYKVCDCCSCSVDTVQKCVNCPVPPTIETKNITISSCPPYPTIDLAAQLTGKSGLEYYEYFKWTVTDVPSSSKVTTHDIKNALTMQASFEPDVDGTYQFDISVEGVCSTVSAPTTVKVTHVTPTVSCPADQTVSIDQKVLLSGAATSGDGSDEFEWKVVKAPAGSELHKKGVMNDKSIDKAFFFADVVGEYLLQLSSTNCETTVKCQTKVIAQCSSPPEADVEPKKAIHDICTPICFDGSYSRDDDGDILHFQWDLVDKPPLSNLSSANLKHRFTCNSCIVADTPGDYKIKFSVSDGCATDTEVVSLTAGCDKRPAASFVGDDHVYVPKECEVPSIPIECQAHDEDKDKLRYEIFVSKAPSGSTFKGGTLLSATNKYDFSPDVTGDYQFECKVYDCCPIPTTVHKSITYACPSHITCDAGPAQDVVLSESGMTTVTLDGCSSKQHVDEGFVTKFQEIDCETDLQYSWAITRAPEGSSKHELKSDKKCSTDLEFRTAGTYDLKLCTHDYCAETCCTTSITARCNQNYDVYAGPDQTHTLVCPASGGKSKPEPVEVFGTQTADQEGLQCFWEFICTPPDSKLTDDDIEQKFSPDGTPGKFQADAAGEFVLRYNCAKDACEVFDKVVVTVEAPPVVPIIDPVDDITLDCSATAHKISGENSKYVVDYRWAISSKPDASSPVLDNTDTAVASFKPDIPGSYFVTLFTTNCAKITRSTTREVKVVDSFESGKADMKCSAGHNQVVHWSAHKNDSVAVMLSGTPVDASKLKYHWSFDFLPAASQLTDDDLEGADSADASFFPDTLGKYGLKFDVHDCSTSFCSKTVEIQVVCNDVGDAVSAGKDVNAEFNGGEVEVCGKPSFHREVSYLWSLSRVSGFRIPTVYANAAGVDLGAAGPGKVVDLNTAVVQVAGEWEAIKNVTYEWSFKSVPDGSKLNDEHIEFRRGMAINVGSARFEPDVAGSYDLLLVAKNGEAAAYDTMTVDVGGTAHPAVDVVSTSDVVVADALLAARDEQTTKGRSKAVGGSSFVAMVVGVALGVVAMFAAARVIRKKQQQTDSSATTMMPRFDTTQGASL